MAYIVLVINAPNNSIVDLNNRCQFPGNTQESLLACKQLLKAIVAGHLPASVQVTTRDTDPSVGTSGSGSDQETYDHR